MDHSQLRKWAAALAMAGAAAGGLAAAGADTRVVVAVKAHDLTAVKSLVVQHASVNGALADGTTALLVAAERNDVDAADLLIAAGADVQASNRYGATPLWAAAANANAAMVERLLKAGARANAVALGGEPPLMAAARSGSVDAVQMLIAAGGEVNATETLRGQTALMWAVGEYEPHSGVARALLEHGADPNIHANSGFTALLFAARQGDLETVRVLVDHGAKANDPSPAGSPLLMAVNNGNFAVAGFLVEHGAEANAPDRNGYAPLHRVVLKRSQQRAGRFPVASSVDQSTALLKTLLAHGADPNLKTLNAPPKPVDAEPNPRPSIDELDLSGVSPFWLAASAADVEAMRLFVDAGADPNTRSADGTTALMVAAGLGQGFRGGGARRGRDSERDAASAIALLLNWGSDIDAVNEHGQTALHGAADAVSPAALKLLFDRGARLTVKDGIGRTPFMIVDDHKTDKYRSNQDFDPVQIESAWTLLRSLSGESAAR